VTRMAMEGKKMIFEKLTPIAESSDKSLPLVVASPEQQQPSVEELPVAQHPCEQLITQPPSVQKLPTQQGVALLSTSAGDDDYVLPIQEEVDFTLPSDDPDEDDISTSCAALQLCCDPNSNKDIKIVVCSSMSSNVQPRPKYFSKPKSFSSAGDDFFPFHFCPHQRLNLLSD